MWRRAVVAVSVALLATATQAQPHVCPDGQFPVSVLDDPQVRCITSRPCSGVYGPQGLLTGVGACPAGTGCALLPQNPSVMGCVIAGRADVSYVNPDGSLTKGGQVIAGPPANNNSGNNAQPTAAPTTATSTAPTPTATNNGANNGANNANKNTTTPAPTTAAPATTLPTTPGSVKPGGGDDATTAPTPTTTSASSAKSDAPATTTATPTNSQNALDNISGEIANNKRGVDAKSLGFTSIIAIVVGCLAVVAIIAGVFVLRKKKEQSIGTPEGALEDYGAGGVTPKENVLLL